MTGSGEFSYEPRPKSEFRARYISNKHSQERLGADSPGPFVYFPEKPNKHVPAAIFGIASDKG